MTDQGKGYQGWDATTALNNGTNDTNGGISVAESATPPANVNNAIRGMMLRFAQYLDDQGFPIAGGTADAITLTPANIINAYVDLQVYTFTAAFSNATTTPGLNVSGAGSKAIRKISGGTDIAVSAGDIVVGAPHQVVYKTAANSGGGAWILINPGGGQFYPAAGGQINTGSSGPGSPATFAVRTSGTFGGGYLLIDSAFYAGMWTASGHFIIGTGTVSGLTSAIDIDGSQNVIGGSIATVAQYRANTTGKLLTTDSTWPAMAVVTLTDASTITWDMSTGIDFQVTLGGNRTLGNPSNTTVGKRGRIKVIQDGTGTRTLTKSSNCKTVSGAALTLSTAAGTVDYLDYDCISSTEIRLSLSKAWS